MMGPHHCQIRALCPREWNTALHHRQPRQSVPTAVQLSWHPCRPSAPSRRTCAVCLSRLISISLAVSEHRSSWAAARPHVGWCLDVCDSAVVQFIPGWCRQRTLQGHPQSQLPASHCIIGSRRSGCLSDVLLCGCGRREWLLDISLSLWDTVLACPSWLWGALSRSPGWSLLVICMLSATSSCLGVMAPLGENVCHPCLWMCM